MTQRKTLSSRPLTAETQLDMLNREIVPVLRQVVKATVVSGSRSSDTAIILGQVLTILANAGVLTDETSP